MSGKTPVSKQQEEQLQVYADLAQLYPDNEAYAKQYADLLLDAGQESTATEILRKLHAMQLANGETSKADRLVKQYPFIGRVRTSQSGQDEILTLLPAAMRNRLWTRLNQKRLREGQHLVHRGEMGDTLFLVCDGELAEFSRDAKGQPVLLGLVGPGDVIAEDKLLNPGAYKTDVVANKSSTIIKLPRKKMMAALVGSPALKMTLQRKADFRRMISIISASSILQSLPLEMRRNLAEASFIEKYPAGSTIHKAGEKLQHVDLIVQGQASFQLQNQGTIKELKSLKPGALVGESAAIQNTGCPANMFTNTGVGIVHIPYGTFVNVVEAYPPLRKNLFAYAEKQQAQLMRKLNELQTQELRH